MSRMNNVSRSLIIMSKMNGWDPTKIEGFDSDSLAYKENIPTDGTRNWMPPEGGPPEPRMQDMPPPHIEHNQAGHSGTGAAGTGNPAGASPAGPGDPGTGQGGAGQPIA